MVEATAHMPLNKSKVEKDASNLEIRKIRQDLDMLVMLYQRLADRMIPAEDATKEEKEALASTDHIFSRADLDKAP